MLVARATRILQIATCLTGVLAGVAQAGLGDGFGTRDPAACPIRNIPKSGAPSQPQMLRYLACDTDRIGDMGEHIYLIGNPELEVVPKARPFNAVTDANAGLDPKQPVFDIHGNFRVYQCARKGSVTWNSNPGHACRYQSFFDASGLCGRDQHAEWHCSMSYKFDVAHTIHDAEPPN